MSTLGDLENRIVSKLQATAIGGEAAFVVVRGVSGGLGARLDAALRRERMPAAYVVFDSHQDAPETSASRCGYQFEIVAATRSLRLGSDPRRDDVETPGVYTLVDVIRAALDDRDVGAAGRLAYLRAAPGQDDERVAVVRILYRISVPEEPEDGRRLLQALTLGGTVLGGPLSGFEVEPGPLRADDFELNYHAGMGRYRKTLCGVRTIVCRGELVAPTTSALRQLEDELETLSLDDKEADLTEIGGRVFKDCAFEAFIRRGGWRKRSSEFAQPADLVFTQKRETP